MTLCIAHVTATFPPYQGGTGNVCYHNARELARHGHDVHVFTAATPGTARREVRDGFTIHRLRPWVRVGNAPVLPGLLGTLRGFDIIHLHCPFILGAEITSLAATLNKTRFVVTYHNDLIGSGTWRDAIFRLATWSGRHMVLGQADRVLFVSQGHAETSDQRLVYYQRREQSIILPNGVDTDAFIPRPDKTNTRMALHLPVEAQVVGFIGGLDRAHHYKGLNILLAALATPALASVHLLVIGDGELKEQYRQQAYQLGLGERILFYGTVAQKMLPPFYRACDVIAMPSVAPESFGLVVIEALACGIPVVATEGPGVGTLVEHGHDGLLVEVNNPVALAQALQQLLSNDAARLAMGRRGRAKVEGSYGWKRIGRQLEVIYNDVLAFGPYRLREEGRV